ncbi:hypothetical protein A8C56_07390 [Niabella ginsenosidivorans]|uniref:Uncharacterized protein n=1 Tax=Niabella ginsenosidivorans TaxID=1176587 RepID=A0A1A9HZM1_9BACT|nr:hypothetical protein [Niabella ginsenosidivorans]ANH80826.1 hypothetical protein A8C56_07390 [Niabella ginsenosidivorans]
MEHYFELPVTYKNENLLLNGRLVTFAYDYKFYVNVKGQELIFEQDDELNFRAIARQPDARNSIDKELIEKISDVLKSLRQR